MRKCVICNSVKGTVYTDGIGVLCGKHNIQYKRHGKILESTRFDKNKIIKYSDDISLLVLKNSNSEIVGYVKLDNVIVNKVILYKWYLSKYGYAVNSIHGLYLHRYILNIDNDNIIIDHLNKDRLDNRLINLRLCGKKENGENCILSVNNSSGYTGVSYNKNAKKWEAYASGKYLGLFTNVEDAVSKRDTFENENYKHKNLIIPKIIEYHEK